MTADLLNRFQRFAGVGAALNPKVSTVVVWRGAVTGAHRQWLLVNGLARFRL